MINITITDNVTRNKIFEEGNLSKFAAKALRAGVGPKLKKHMEEPIRNWSHKPSIQIKSKSLSTKAYVTGKPFGRGKRFWIWVSQGTPNRTITSKRPDGKMVFKRFYNPKTKAGGSWNNPSRRHGPTVYTSLVKNHSIKPRQFEEEIANRREDEYFTIFKNMFFKELGL